MVITVAFLAVSKTFSVGMHSGICELISCRLGVVLVSTELCILNEVWVILIWFKTTGVWESKHFCVNLLSKFSTDFVDIWYAVETYSVFLVCWILTHFVLPKQYLWDRALTGVISLVRKQEVLKWSIFAMLTGLVHSHFPYIINHH